MAYFPDLTPYEYFLETDPPVNVGWLDQAHSFQHGDAPEGFVEQLRVLGQSPVKTTRGYHHCDFCGNLEGRFISDEELSDAEIRVRGADGTTYAAPCLILHYVTAHHYLPPQQFIDAVMLAAAPAAGEGKP
jgi:hypothetical protein